MRPIEPDGRDALQGAFARASDTGDRGEQGVPVHQLQIPTELLDAVDLAAAFDLDGHRCPAAVPAQDVDGADRGHELPADQGVPLAE